MGDVAGNGTAGGSAKPVKPGAVCLCLGEVWNIPRVQGFFLARARSEGDGQLSVCLSWWDRRRLSKGRGFLTPRPPGGRSAQPPVSPLLVTSRKRVLDVKRTRCKFGVQKQWTWWKRRLLENASHAQTKGRCKGDLFANCHGYFVWVEAMESCGEEPAGLGSAGPGSFVSKDAAFAWGAPGSASSLRYWRTAFQDDSSVPGLALCCWTTHVVCPRP